MFLLLNETEICNYADDTTIYCPHKELQEVALRLENDTGELMGHELGCNIFEISIICGDQTYHTSFDGSFPLLSEYV